MQSALTSRISSLDNSVLPRLQINLRKILDGTNLQNGNQNTILTVIEYALFYFSEELRELTDLFPTIPQPEYINIVTY